MTRSRDCLKLALIAQIGVDRLLAGRWLRAGFEARLAGRRLAGCFGSPAAGVTTTVVSAQAGARPAAVAVTRTRYTPGAVKVAVVAADCAEANAAVPGPSTVDQRSRNRLVS